MKTSYKFKNKKGKERWNEFRNIIKEYNLFATKELPSLPIIKVNGFYETIEEIKNTFDNMFFGKSIKDIDDYVEVYNFPKRIYKVYRKIESEDKTYNYLKINRDIIEKINEINKPLVFSVYCWLKYYAKDQGENEGETFVGVETIAKKIGMSQRYTTDLIKLLVDNGLVENRFKRGSRKPMRKIL